MAWGWPPKEWSVVDLAMMPSVPPCSSQHMSGTYGRDLNALPRRKPCCMNAQLGYLDGHCVPTPRKLLVVSSKGQDTNANSSSMLHDPSSLCGEHVVFVAYSRSIPRRVDKLELLSADSSHQPLRCHPPSHELKGLDGHLADDFETVDNDPGWGPALP